MTKIFKQLARHWAACLAVAALLIVQAYCDLSLPDYTSKIVDVGIQQGGIDGKNFDSIIGYLLNNDTYMSLADFESYRQCHSQVGSIYQDPSTWNRMSLINIAKTGVFSADRAVNDYIRTIWYK